MSTTTSRQFLLDINKELEKDVINPANVIIRRAAELGYEAVTTLQRDGGRVPINTGYFRSNWKQTLNAPSESSGIEPSDSQRPQTSMYAPDQYSGEYNMSAAYAKRSRANFSIKTHTGFFLTNHTSYGRRLSYEYGLMSFAENVTRAELNKINRL